MKNKGKIYRFILGGVLLAMALSTISCGGSDSASNSHEGGLDVDQKRKEAEESIRG